MKEVAALLQRVIGSFDRYCCGCGMQPTDAYVTTPLISTGVTTLQCSHSGSQLLDHIIAFDRAEASFANITQTNMIAVSSFNGLHGLLLGYDILPQRLAAHPLLGSKTGLDIYDAEPLFAATQALYGTIAHQRFPIAPGQHILCAYKTLYRNGPCVLYGALAVAIAKDRDGNADLFMEDHGILVGTNSEAANAEQESAVLHNLIDAVGKIGDNLAVQYHQIFIGFRSCVVEAGEVGCVLTAVPYIRLAQKAVPGNQPELLHQMSLQQWEEATQPYFLQP